MYERIGRFLSYLLEERSFSQSTVSAYRNDLARFADYLCGIAKQPLGSSFEVSSIDGSVINGFLLRVRDQRPNS